MTFQKGNQINKGRKLTEEQKKNHHKWGNNEKNPNWKDGITKLNRKIRSSLQNREWIKKCLIRDGFTCQVCKQMNHESEVHHINPLYKILIENNIQTYEDAMNCLELWDICNGITLCENCHIKIDEHRRGKDEYY